MASALRAMRPMAARFAVPVARPAVRGFSTTRVALERRYTKDHEWIDLSPSSTTATIGISKYAAEQLGDVVYVELPAAGTELEGGDTLGAIESVKSASDINAPVSCTVVEANDELEQKPASVNKLPEDDSNGGGWIARVEVSDAGKKEFEDLMNGEAYKAFVDE